MTLSDRTIIRQLKLGEQLSIEVAEQYRYADERWNIDPSQFQPVSIDLRLGDVSDIEGRRAMGFVLDGYQLKPGEFALGCTIEKITLGPRLVGKVEGKSTIARGGMLVEAAGVVDPGFTGTITLELFNMGPHPVGLRRGMRICQLLLDWTDVEPDRTYGSDGLGSHYQNQSGPTPARH